MYYHSISLFATIIGLK